MTKKEVWGIEYQLLYDFFLTQPDVIHTENGSFQFKSCRIHIELLSESILGSLHLPRTSIEFSGESHDVTLIYHRFFMRFLSAGG